MCCCRYSHGEPAHMPVHTHVFAAFRMARNVRPLKVLEGGVKLPPHWRRCCCVQLCHPVDRTRNPQITATPRHTRTNSLLAGRNFRLVRTPIWCQRCSPYRRTAAAPHGRVPAEEIAGIWA